MKQRQDTKANWAAANPVLLDGELGMVSDDRNLYKVGDGRTAWNDLPFRGFDGTLAQELGTSANAAISQKAVTEKLTELSAETMGYIGKRYMAELIGRGVNERGYVISSIWNASEIIPVSQGQEIYYTGSTPEKSLTIIGYSNQAFDGAISLIDGSGAANFVAHRIVIPNGVNYIIFAGRSNSPLYLDIPKNLPSYIDSLRDYKIQPIILDQSNTRMINQTGDLTWFPDGLFSGYIPVKEGEKYIYSGKSTDMYIGVAGYDAQRKFICSIIQDNASAIIRQEICEGVEFTIPAGVYYIGAMTRDNKVNPLYIARKLYAIDVADAPIVQPITTKVFADEGIYSENGDSFISIPWERTDYIKVSEGELITISAKFSGGTGLAGYDKDKKFFLRLGDNTDGTWYTQQVCSNTIVRIPKGVSYIRVSTSDKDNYPVSVGRLQSYADALQSAEIAEDAKFVEVVKHINSADEEDITAIDGKLKLKDRASNSGKGYVIVRANKSFAEQVIASNTIYEIRYDVNLNGETITLNDGCELRFVGGSIKNGTIVLRGTLLSGDVRIYCDFEGWVANDNVLVEWFDIVKNDISAAQRNYKIINDALKLLLANRTHYNTNRHYGSLIFPNGELYIEGNGVLSLTLDDIQKISNPSVDACRRRYTLTGNGRESSKLILVNNTAEDSWFYDGNKAGDNLSLHGSFDVVNIAFTTANIAVAKNKKTYCNGFKFYGTGKDNFIKFESCSFGDLDVAICCTGVANADHIRVFNCDAYELREAFWVSDNQESVDNTIIGSSITTNGDVVKVLGGGDLHIESCFIGLFAPSDANGVPQDKQGHIIHNVGVVGAGNNIFSLNHIRWETYGTKKGLLLNDTNAGCIVVNANSCDFSHNEMRGFDGANSCDFISIARGSAMVSLLGCNLRGFHRMQIADLGYMTSNISISDCWFCDSIEDFKQGLKPVCSVLGSNSSISCKGLKFLCGYYNIGDVVVGGDFSLGKIRDDVHTFTLRYNGGKYLSQPLRALLMQNILITGMELYKSASSISNHSMRFRLETYRGGYELASLDSAPEYYSENLLHKPIPIPEWEKYDFIWLTAEGDSEYISDDCIATLTITYKTIENGVYIQDTSESPFAVLQKVNKRPVLNANDKGVSIFDPNLNKPIWWTGANWVDATGDVVE